MFEGATLYFSASFFTTESSMSGAPSDPSGEYAVTTMPCFLHSCTMSSCMQELTQISNNVSTTRVVGHPIVLTDDFRSGSPRERLLRT